MISEEEGPKAEESVHLLRLANAQAFPLWWGRKKERRVRAKLPVLWGTNDPGIQGSWSFLHHLPIPFSMTCLFSLLGHVYWALNYSVSGPDTGHWAWASPETGGITFWTRPSWSSSSHQRVLLLSVLEQRKGWTNNLYILTNDILSLFIINYFMSPIILTSTKWLKTSTHHQSANNWRKDRFEQHQKN